jgi:hypothetical protein
MSKIMRKTIRFVGRRWRRRPAKNLSIKRNLIREKLSKNTKPRQKIPFGFIKVEKLKSI